MPLFSNKKRKLSNDHVTPYPKMAAKDRDRPRSMTTTKLCIGNYVLGTTLGVGTFGKVKSKCFSGLLFLISTRWRDNGKREGHHVRKTRKRSHGLFACRRKCLQQELVLKCSRKRDDLQFK